MNDSTTGPVGAVAARLRMTEGQLYSSVITLAVAVLLASGLGNVHGVVSSALAQPPLAAVPEDGLPTSPAPAPEPFAAAPTLPTAALSPFDLGPVPLPLPAPAPWPAAPGGPAGPAGPAPSPQPSPTPSAAPCTAQPVDDAGAELVRAINAAAGGGLPERDLLAAIRLITGCDPDDPAVVAIGLLIGIGRTLPDPGLPDPPVIPVVQIPASVVAALQPLRPAIDEVCGVIGIGSVVTSLFVSDYPRPISVTTTQVLFQALSVCGQLRAP